MNNQLKRITRSLIGLMCAFCIAFLSFSVPAKAQSNVSDLPGTKATRYLSSLGTVRSQILPPQETIHLYSDPALSNYVKTITPNFKFNKYHALYGFNSSYNSIRVKCGSQYYYTYASAFLVNPDFRIYDYYTVSDVPTYQPVSLSSSLSEVKEASFVIPKDSYVTVIGRTNSMCQVVYNDERILLVKKSDLYSRPVNNKYAGNYSITSKAFKPTKISELYDCYTLSAPGSTLSGVKDGANVCIKRNDICNAQGGASHNTLGDVQWCITYNSSYGFYQIYCDPVFGEKKYLCAENNSYKCGANLVVTANSKATGTRFQIIRNSDGSYSLRSILGMYVDVDGGIVENNRNVQLYLGNGTDAQKWDINYKPID